MIGYIYEMNCPCGLKYIGSTNHYRMRINSHYSDLKSRKQEQKNYKHINNCNFEGPLHFLEIISLTVDDELELRGFEDYYIKLYNTVENGLNSRYAIANIEERLKYQANYRIINAEEINKRVRQYYNLNKETINETRRENYKEDETYRDNILKQNKQYRLKNKEKIYKHNSKIVICECGIQSTHNHLSRHMKTQKHLDIINNIQKIHPYTIVICECGIQSTHGHLSRHMKTQKHIELMKLKN